MLRGHNSASNRTILIVTGFGTFSGVAANPTQRMVQEELPKHVPKEVTLSDGQVLEVHYFILEVSVQYCDKFVQDITQQFKNYRIIFLHLGVDASSTAMKLEQCAYNNQNFRVPDEQGFQPINQPIQSAIHLDYPVISAWKTEQLRYQLNEHLLSKGLIKSLDESIVNLSNDPGRYLCNYIYFRTLLHQQYNNSGSALPTRSLFVHVPYFDKITMETQLEVIQQLMHILPTTFLSELQS